MKRLFFACLTLAACGGAIEVIATPLPITDPPTYAEAGSAPDARPTDAGASDSPHDASDSSAPLDDGGRYVITPRLGGDLVYDRTTGLTWYGRFIYGSASLNNADVCDWIDAGMRRATIAEGLTILNQPDDAGVADGAYPYPEWDWPFWWSNFIASQCSDGCINLPPFSVGECQGDLINNLCVKGPGP